MGTARRQDIVDSNQGFSKVLSCSQERRDLRKELQLYQEITIKD